MALVKRNGKLLTKILAVLVLAVWGEIAYQLFAKKAPGTGDSTPVITDKVSAHTAGQKYIFKDNVRDPFAYFKPVIQVQKKKFVPLIVHIWTPPPVSLEGVMLGNGRRTAIIADRAGQTYFLSPGDTLDGVSILAVMDTEVSYRYDRKDTNWIVVRN